MGVSVFPAPSAASKTMYRTTLTSGTSYTVPAGVTYLNVTLYGGGGGNRGTNTSSGMPPAVSGSVVSSIVTTSPGASIAYAIGAGGAGGVGANVAGSPGGNTTFTGATSAPGGGAGVGTSDKSADGPNYRGAGNAPSSLNASSTASRDGATGGSGCIDIEYWA
jgi:hypothetical protein